MYTQTLLIIMGGPGTGKIVLIKAEMKILNGTVTNITSVLRLCTTGTVIFVIPAL